MTVYYNEIDPYCCQWLKNLILAGHLPKGDVDDRDIREVQPDDLRGYTQAHFFAGIGGWPYALRLAGWPDDRPVWTGSCPCQPFSAAGKGKASGDERHLWPAWFRLIKACRPGRLFGEQVDAAIRWGWLDLVYSDLEAEGYSVGAAVLPACSVGAPHIRQRLWFVADALRGRADNASRQGMGTQAEINGENGDISGERLRLGVEGSTSELGHARGKPSERGTRSLLGEETAQQSQGLANGSEPHRLADASQTGELVNSQRGRCEQRDESERELSESCQTVSDGALADAKYHVWRADFTRRQTQERKTNGRLNPGWSNLAWLPCTDGKQRPTKPGIFPLAHGIPAILVVVCSECGKETRIDESRLGNINHAQQWAQTGPEAVFGSELREMRNQPEEVGAPSQERQSNGQSRGQHRNPLHEMPSGTSPPATNNIRVRGMRGNIRGKGSSESQESQMLFCSVCERVGPHLCIEKVARSRIKMLRAAGNAIIPQVAAEFIKATMNA